MIVMVTIMLHGDDNGNHDGDGNDNVDVEDNEDDDDNEEDGDDDDDDDDAVYDPYLVSIEDGLQAGIALYLAPILGFEHGHGAVR